MLKKIKHFFLFICVGVLCVFLFFLIKYDTFKVNRLELSFSEFLYQVNICQVNSVKIHGNVIEGVLLNGQNFSTYGIKYPYLIEKLYNNGVHISIVPVNMKLSSFLSFLLSWIPMLFLIGIWLFFMKQIHSGKGIGFGKSKARLMSGGLSKVTFDDVAGIDEAKDELLDIVNFLKNPSKYNEIGGYIPKGCILIGSPGTGKTLLARAVAGEANVPFFSISGSDFVEMFVGVGASRVRDMFAKGKKYAPCIIFIDEIDAVGRHRGVGLGGGNDEREQTLNQILVEMDGFELNQGIIIIAATNRTDILDPALLRPGRFDRQIIISNPDALGRKQILQIYVKNVKCATDIDLDIISRSTPGFSGAALKNLVNEAALLAVKLNKSVVDMYSFELSRDKILMGLERKGLVMSESERRLIAYHESGHALVSLYSSVSDPIHKATIIPRGSSLGMVLKLPTSDKFSVSLDKMESDIAVAMGGRVAEEVIFGMSKVTSGAASDIKFATNLAKSMVTEWGFSSKVGLVFHGNSTEDLYSSFSCHSTKDKSEKMAEIIDFEIKKVIDKGYVCAKEIITNHLSQLHILANALIEKETLSGKEIQKLLHY